ncbi:MAG: right-handed parallel beta-helix repeat-containing protein [Nitrospirota bacterium]
MNQVTLREGRAVLAIAFLLPWFTSEPVNAGVRDNSVTSAKVVDESLTGADIQNNTLTGADIQNGSLTRGDLQPVAHQVVVATSGGDYTSVSAALAAITPSATDPYVIEVMPGTYTDNISMKSYVHLRGAGREVTTIQSPSTSSDVVTLTNVTNAAISGLTIAGGRHGINMFGSSATITGNTISGNSRRGMVLDFSTPIIRGNTITGNLDGGIENISASPTIVDNTITANSSFGIVSNSSSPTIARNIITGNTAFGIDNINSPSLIRDNVIAGHTFGVSTMTSSSSTILNNRITGNASADISVDATSIPNISFNLYDTITGTTGIGSFNVNSNGDPAPAP